MLLLDVAGLFCSVLHWISTEKLSHAMRAGLVGMGMVARIKKTSHAGEGGGVEIGAPRAQTAISEERY
jgi:hypothetical protein